MKLKIGILREEKTPPDRRVPLTPAQCRLLLERYPQLEIVAQPSEHRAFTNAEYEASNIQLQENLSDRDIILGVKEVPPHLLIPGKTYLFFSHTIKEQPYNKKLLQTILERKVRMVDYECLTNSNQVRIIGFGHYAGIVGAYNGLRAYGIRSGRYQLKSAYQCHDRIEMENELAKIDLPPVRIIVTGSGRVAHGAMEILEKAGIEKVDPDLFVTGIFTHPVYAQLHSEDYHVLKSGEPWDTQHFYANPHLYESTFGRFLPHCDILMHCAYWHPDSPVLFTEDDMRTKEFKIKVIADVTCDIRGSIPSTIRPSTIENPFYGFDPATGKESEAFEKDVVTVMAVDNLPCELPRDASKDFGHELIENVIPAFLENDPEGVIQRATIAEDGKLSEGYLYLSDYAS